MAAIPPNRTPDLTAALVKALVLYSLAEAQAGHASSIHVQADGNAFVVQDNGRGHPIDKEINGTPYVSFIYEHFAFPFGAVTPGAVQLHGIGLSLINALCSELQVTVLRSGQTLDLTFQNGSLVSRVQEPTAEASSGNTVRGLVRQEYATSPVNHAALESWLRDAQRAVPAAIITFNHNTLVASQERGA